MYVLGCALKSSFGVAVPGLAKHDRSMLDGNWHQRLLIWSLTSTFLLIFFPLGALFPEYRHPRVVWEKFPLTTVKGMVSLPLQVRDGVSQ